MSRFPRPGRTPRPRPVPTAGPTPTPSPTPSPIGNTFTLTTSADSVVGNVGVINGTYLQPGALNVYTAQNIDAIATTASSAVANINVLSTAPTLGFATQPVYNGVTTFNITNSVGLNTIDAGILPNATALNIASNGSGSTGYSITNAGTSLASLGLSGNTAIGNSSITFASGTRIGSADAFALSFANNITGVGGVIGNQDVIGAGGGAIEILNVTATGANALSRLTSAASAGGASTLTTLNISGTGSLLVGASLQFAGTTSTINASANTGGVTLGVAGTTATTFTGGSGNDSLTFAAGEFTNADVINFGAGINTLGLSDTTINATTTNLNNLINAVTSAQVIGLAAANTTIDLSRINQSTVSLGATGANVQNAAATDIVLVSGVDLSGGATTLQGALGFNTLNLALEGSAFNAEARLGALDITNQANVNIVTRTLGAAPITNSIGAVLNTANANITITGPQAISIASLNAAASVNASALVRPLTITTANAVNSSVTGGSGNDTINGGTGADTLIGGAGIDTFAVGATAANGARYSPGLGADIITLADTAAAATNRTATYAATAAESFATAGQFDTITFANSAATDNRTITTSTGVNASSVVAGTSATLGATTVAANGFLVVNAAGSLNATNQSAVVFQDSNGNGIIDATDFSAAFNISGADTLAFALSAGQLQASFVGV